MDRVVGIGRQDSRHPFANRFGRERGGDQAGGHDSDVERKPVLATWNCDQQAGPGDVQRADEKRHPSGQPGQDRDRVVRPWPADARVGHEDQGQRQQKQRRGRRRVEEELVAQPDLGVCAGRGFGGAPSSGAGAMSMKGRISSMGNGKRMVVFFSEPISTMV